MIPKVRPVSCRPTSFRHSPPRSATLDFRHAVHERDRKCQRELGHRAAIDAAGPSQLDAAPRDRVDVDAVEADAVLADDLQFRQLREDRLVDALEADDRAIVAAQRAPRDRRRRAPRQSR